MTVDNVRVVDETIEALPNLAHRRADLLSLGRSVGPLLIERAIAKYVAGVVQLLDREGANGVIYCDRCHGCHAAPECA